MKCFLAARVFLCLAAFYCIGLMTAPLSAQVFQQCLSNGAPIDSGLPPVVETITVVDDLTVADVTVEIHITHTFQGDLVIDMDAPNGSTTRRFGSASRRRLSIRRVTNFL